MENNHTHKFLTGATIGFGLGVALGMFLSSRRGKIMQENLVHAMKDFYKYAALRAEQIRVMGEKEYHEFMKDAANKYIELKHLSKEAADYISKEIQQSWEELTSRWQERTA